jgi:hypothetical protein
LVILLSLLAGVPVYAVFIPVAVPGDVIVDDENDDVEAVVVVGGDTIPGCSRCLEFGVTLLTPDGAFVIEFIGCC